MISDKMDHVLRVSYDDLVRHLRTSKVNFVNTKEAQKLLCDYISDKFGLQSSEENITTEISRPVINFLVSLSKRWQECSRNVTFFNKKHASWLYGELQIHMPNAAEISLPSTSRGRPKKPFEESGTKTKRKRVSHLIASHSSQELALATRLSLSASGKRTAASVVKEATETSPKRASKIKKAYQDSLQPTPPEFTPEEALSLIMDLKLSKNQYLCLRQRNKEKGFNIYPSYDAIKKAKQDCYPPKASLKITEISAEIDLQALLNHVLGRLLKLQDAVIVSEHLKNVTSDSIEMIYKWGLDGTSGQSIYKQRLSSECSDSENISDSNLLLTSIVPIQLYGLHKKNNQKVILWQNTRTASPRSCLPIHFQFKKETVASTKEEVEHMEAQIRCLESSRVTASNGQIIIIKHKLIMTMVDQKVCNAVTDTSSQTCYVCGASPKDMNNLQELQVKQPNVITYAFGLSTLHAHIRFMECLLHIAYRLDAKEWRITKKGIHHESMQLRKKMIIERFRKETGLVIDQPKQGAGSSNDGNTARRFFEDPAKTAEITGLQESIVHKFSIILSAISSGFPLNENAFRNYLNETAKLYVQHYNWYKMPSSVHKILIHGADIASSCIVPIGQMSEEAQEARNKDYKYYRAYNTRKCSREKTNEDLLHILLISADPVINSLRSPQRKKGRPMTTELLSLLTCPSNLVDGQEIQESSDDD